MCEGCCKGSKKTRMRSPEELKRLCNRLSRIEGQIRGIRGMLEKDAYCMDILDQAAAANAALRAFSGELLAQHLRTCVARDLRAGDEGTVEELAGALQKLMK
ncbi:metal-sensing transcriptional repressor [Acutalibacter caecimuris]|uniref:metal-sensing transcriptional repressor n=1 Tax=Acutalibacter caecimuris TaxID=3093657 RepID=UPI002AC9F077|nr:metal-sensing transcriptional repressor [Acutalibacter sp. M00118]